MLLSELKVEEETMTIDNYTKVILTVIALSTSTLALKGVGIIPTANAQSSGVQKVVICSKYGDTCLYPFLSTEHQKNYLPVLTYSDYKKYIQ